MVHAGKLINILKVISCIYVPGRQCAFNLLCITRKTKHLNVNSKPSVGKFTATEMSYS